MVAETEGKTVTTSVGESHARQPGTGPWPAVPAQQRTVPAARPKPPAPAKPTRARRRPALVALGLALVAVSVLATTYLTTTLGQTQQVLVVVNDVARGEVIEAGDLGTADLPLNHGQLRPVSDDRYATIVESKQRATVDLLPGQLLTEDSMSDVVQPAEGRAIVGVALTAQQMPASTSLQAGDQVSIVETPVAGGEPPIEDPVAIQAVVRSSTQGIGDQWVVDVEVEADRAAGLAARAATGRVALILTSLDDADGDG